MSMKNSHDPIGNRTLNLPACFIIYSSTISASVMSRKESTVKFKFVNGFVEDVSFIRIKYWKEKD